MMASIDAGGLASAAVLHPKAAHVLELLLLVR